MRFTTALMLASATLALGGTAHALAAPQGSTVHSPLPRYSAQAFYDTTSFGLAAPSGFGFSADGRSILVLSDKSGVFNAYALPVAGGNR